MKLNLRLLYLYLFSFVGLLVVVIGGIQVVDLGLKTFVFKDADRYSSYPVAAEKELSQADIEEMQRNQELDMKRQRERQLSNSLAMILIGAPLYLYHWKTIQREEK